MLFLAALLVTVTPSARIDADITVPNVAVVLGGLALVVWGTVREVTTTIQVSRGYGDGPYATTC